MGAAALRLSRPVRKSVRAGLTQEVLDRPQVEGMPASNDHVLDTSLKEVIQPFGLLGNIEENGPFDRAWIAADLAAPLVERLVLLRILLGRAERAPHIGVLRDQSERHLRATYA